MSFEFVAQETPEVDVVILGDDLSDFGVGLVKQGADVSKIKELIKASDQKPYFLERSGFPYMEPRLSFDTLSYFLDISTWHKRCVNLKARLVGGLGWMLVTDDEDKEPDELYNAIEAMLKSPQLERRPGEQKQSFTELVNQMLVDFYSMGNGFLETPRNALGQVSELYHMRALTTRRDRALNKGYHQIDQGQAVAHLRGFEGESPEGRNEVIHFMEYDVKDPWYGMPEWLPAMGVALLDRTTVEYNAALFQNGLMAHFAVIVEGGKLGPNQQQALKDFIRTNATGIENAGRGVVLQNDKDGVKIRVEKLNVDMKNMQITEGRTMTRDEVIAAHGVPPRMVGVMSAGQLGGGGEIQGQLETFLETVVIPDQQRLENLLNSTIIRSFGGSKWRLKFKTMNVKSRQEDANYYKEALNPSTGWLSQDEVREELNKDPMEDDGLSLQGAIQNPQQTAKFLKELRKSYDRV